MTFYAFMRILIYIIKELEKYKAIGEQTRFRIVRLLIKAGKNLCACELIDILKKPQYTVSKHLNILKRAEIVREHRDGRLMKYRLKNDSTFNKRLFKTIKAVEDVSNPIFKKDIERLGKRFSLRKGEKCVCVGKDL